MEPPKTEWSGQRVRDCFVQFYGERQHLNIVSSSVVPHEDPTLLFANAGMNQFKPVFLGTVDPKSDMAKWKRVANSQKCIRAGGKHNDLDDVGKDTYHHTFFEMLGTWSFGDYFKQESIGWGWELLTKAYGLDPKRIYATYFGGDPKAGLPADDEAKQIWLKYLPTERVLPFGMKENFWEMGETGPCGPCSEIHYDRIGGRDVASAVNRDDPTVIEIWNHVFIQFNRDDKGKLNKLPARHVDTGMGLERLTSILQNKMSNYDTDLFTYIFDVIQKATGARPYEGKLGADDPEQIDMAYRVIADHIRTLTFAINDGAVPSNDGRGYVMRRILRRAVRYGRQMLRAKPYFFSELAPVVIEKMSPAFPELRKNPQHIVQVLHREEETFLRTLDKGLKKFERIAVKAKASKQISGKEAFVLSDTYGFPLDLTEIMASERGYTVDRPGFNKELEEARAKSARAASTEKIAIDFDPATIGEVKKLGVAPTDDSAKYLCDLQGNVTSITASVKVIFDGSEFLDAIDAGPTVGVVLDRTNFYGESGGQINDEGYLQVQMDGREARFDVVDVQVYGTYVLHLGKVASGEVRVGDKVSLHVDAKRRLPVMVNHTSTHLLNWALRSVLSRDDGPQRDIEQRGSLVLPERFRFDFSYGQPLTADELRRVDESVNDLVRRDLVVHHRDAGISVAKQIRGVRAVFGEVYPDPVRVVSIGQSVEDLLSNPSNDDWHKFPVEFCGGTHISRTSQVDCFTVVSQEALGAGVRRVVAVTGERARQAARDAEAFGRRVQEVEKLPDDKQLHAAVVKLLHELNDTEKPLVISAHIALQYVRAIEALQERVKNVYKAQVQAENKHSEEFAARVNAALKEKPVKVFVERLDVGGNADALRRATEWIANANPDTAVMLLSVDADAKDKKKVLMYAMVPKALGKKLAAGDWVKEVSKIVDGRGGGRPDIAQSYGADPSRVPEALKLASEFGHSKLQ